jgi:hypothetical protein
MNVAVTCKGAVSWCVVSMALAASGSLAAQTLNGASVRGVLDFPSIALPGVIDKTTTIGPGIEFSFTSSTNTRWTADFEGQTLTFGFFLPAGVAFDGIGDVWRFELGNGLRFSSVTELSDSMPKGMDLISFSGSRASFVLLNSPADPGPIFTPTVDFSGAATYRLGVAGGGVCARGGGVASTVRSALGL